MHDEGALDPLTESLLFSPTRPAEGLYEWTTDRWQVTNLAGDPSQRATLEQLRKQLDQWMIDTHDHGPESDAMYDSDLAAYLGKGVPGVEKNTAIMKQWAKTEQTNPTDSRLNEHDKDAPPAAFGPVDGCVVRPRLGSSTAIFKPQHHFHHG